MSVFDRTDKESAETAAKKLTEQLKHPTWVTDGIGVKKCRGSYVVVVYIDKLSDEIRKKVPMGIDDVPIQLEEIGKVRPVS